MKVVYHYIETNATPLCSFLSYKNKFPQQQISKMLHISRPWISKLLTRAEEMGIVEIHANASVYENQEFSGQSLMKYGLTYACTVMTEDGNTDSGVV